MAQINLAPGGTKGARLVVAEKTARLGGVGFEGVVTGCAALQPSFHGGVGKMDKAHGRSEWDALHLGLEALDAEILIRAHAAGGPDGADQAVVFPSACSFPQDAGIQAGDIALTVGRAAHRAIRSARAAGRNLVGAANIDLLPSLFIATGVGIGVALRRVAGDIATLAGHHACSLSRLLAGCPAGRLAYMLPRQPDAHIACQHVSNVVWSGS